MEYFFVLLGFGFILICMIPVILVLTICKYYLHITLSNGKKIEVAPADSNSDSNDSGKD